MNFEYSNSFEYLKKYLINFATKSKYKNTSPDLLIFLFNDKTPYNALGILLDIYNGIWAGEVFPLVLKTIIHLS